MKLLLILAVIISFLSAIFTAGYAPDYTSED